MDQLRDAVIAAAVEWKVCRVAAMHHVSPATFGRLAEAEAALVAAVSEIGSLTPSLQKETP